MRADDVAAGGDGIVSGGVDAVVVELEDVLLGEDGGDLLSRKRLEDGDGLGARERLRLFGAGESAHVNFLAMK
jgi:hypothetical protein